MAAARQGVVLGPVMHGLMLPTFISDFYAPIMHLSHSLADRVSLSNHRHQAEATIPKVRPVRHRK